MQIPTGEKKGGKVIEVENASKWRKNEAYALTLRAQDDNSPRQSNLRNRLDMMKGLTQLF